MTMNMSQNYVIVYLTNYSRHISSFVNPNSDEIETDETVLMRRQKQIDYGKCNESYEQYSAKYPR